MTEVFNDISKFQMKINTAKDSIGFVPSLGALHEGHISLIKRSLNENSHTVVSLFLNPTQFNDKNDLKNYPNTFDDDLKILQNLKVDFLLAPEPNNIYPDDYTYKINETKLSNVLCGATRPGHFTGVLTIVAKLLNIVNPNRAYFGEKDYQQYLLIDYMTKALFMKTKIVPCPIIREPSGLALSSRNLLLTEGEKLIAPNLHKIISSDSSISDMHTQLTGFGFKVDYIEEHWGRLFAAAFLGNVRLIDNVQI